MTKITSNLTNNSSDAGWQKNQTKEAYFEMFAQPVSLELYMTFTIVAASVAIIAFILLLHLSMFHIYINYVGITTYEYVRAVRISMDQNNITSSSTSANNFLEDLPPTTITNHQNNTK